MIANTSAHDFDVIEITNEMPTNRIGGVGSVVENLYTGFSDLGVNALWFVVDHGYQGFEIKTILNSYRSVAIGGYQDLEHFHAPVAHLHSYFSNADLEHYLTGTRSLFTIHSLLAYEELSNNVDLPTLVAGQEANIRACDEVVLVSAAEHRYYLKLGYHRLNPRVSVVHNGVRPSGRQRSPRGRSVLGYCGRLVPRKQPQYIQKALLEPGFEGATALIAGKAFSPFARDLVQDLGIEDRVRYLGWCGGERLEAFWHAADVLVLPSTYEPFGLAALEAVARRVPVVATPADGLAEVLGDHVFWADNTSYEAFMDALGRWHGADDDTLDQITAAAQQRYLERFTDRVMAQEYIDRFEALCAPDDHTRRRRGAEDCV